jgi:hypothetical protein
MMTDYDYQQMNAAKADIFKCNIVFRKNLVQVLFCLLLMIICTLQIEAENQFLINQTMRDHIYRLKKVDYATSIKDLAVWSRDRTTDADFTYYTNTCLSSRCRPWWQDLENLKTEKNKAKSESTGNKQASKDDSSTFYHFEDKSKKLSLISLDSVKDLNDTYMFLHSIVPRIGQNLDVESVWNKSNPEVKTKFKAFFINREEYIIGDLIRLSFSINPRNVDFFAEMAKLERSSPAIHYGSYGDNIFLDDDNPDAEAARMRARASSLVLGGLMAPTSGGVVGAAPMNEAAFDSVNSTWYKSLIAIPGFLKNEVIGRNKTL